MSAPVKIPGYATDTISETGLLSHEQITLMMCFVTYVEP